jgi:flavodoxin
MRLPSVAFSLITLFTICAFAGSQTFAQERSMVKILIIYYSRTGNTKMCCEALQKELGADMIEIKDLKSRSGGWGFFTGAMGSMFDVHTNIDPLHPDITPYKNIIIASPIWTGTLSTAIRTLIDKNKFDSKKVVLFTTTNAAEKDKYIEKSKARVAHNGTQVVGYYQVVVKKEVDKKKIDKAREEIVSDAMKFIPEIKRAFAK